MLGGHIRLTILPLEDTIVIILGFNILHMATVIDKARFPSYTHSLVRLHSELTH